MRVCITRTRMRTQWSLCVAFTLISRLVAKNGSDQPHRPQSGLRPRGEHDDRWRSGSVCREAWQIRSILPLALAVTRTNSSVRATAQLPRLTYARGLSDLQWLAQSCRAVVRDQRMGLLFRRGIDCGDTENYPFPAPKRSTALN